MEKISGFHAIHYDDTTWIFVKSTMLKKSWNTILSDEQNEIQKTEVLIVLICRVHLGHEILSGNSIINKINIKRRMLLELTTIVCRVIYE